MDTRRFEKWAEREYSAKQRITALVPAGLLFVVVIPYFLIVASAALDRWLHLHRFVYGPANAVIGLLFFVVPGWVFAMWSVQTQFTLGRGTPMPIMATQKLVVEGPYAYCRNPMAWGTILFYLGIGIWIGSFSAIGLILLFAALLTIYIKEVEERELEARFGAEYLAYKQSTPFLRPRLRRIANDVYVSAETTRLDDLPVGWMAQMDVQDAAPVVANGPGAVAEPAISGAHHDRAGQWSAPPHHA